MEKIEIRQDKKIFLIILVLVVIMQIFIIPQVYFTNNVNTTVKVFFGVVALISFYSLYLPIKRLIRNEPVLTFSRSEITILEKNKPVSYLWLQINDWKIEKDFDGDGKYLILETTEGKKKVNIASLEMDPDEIEELINEYKNTGREGTLSNPTQ